MEMMLPAREVLEWDAHLMKLLGNPTRLAILHLLLAREVTVGEFCDRLKKRGATVSQHLAILRHARLVRARQRGLHVYYRLADRRILEPLRVIQRLRRDRVLT